MKTKERSVFLSTHKIRPFYNAITLHKVEYKTCSFSPPITCLISGVVARKKKSFLKLLLSPHSSSELITILVLCIFHKFIFNFSISYMFSLLSRDQIICTQCNAIVQFQSLILIRAFYPSVQ